jgi:chloramphenicol O-acetyltransferase type A
MKAIDLNHWDRKEVYDFYKGLDHPMFSITVQMDVTHLYQKVKLEKTSFYLSFMHIALQEMNKMEAFKYRFMQEEPVIFDVIHPSYTDLIPNTERFKIVTVDFLEDRLSFIKSAQEASSIQGDQFIDLSKEVQSDLVYISTFPWAGFTQITHAHNINKYDAIPRLTWGKFVDVNGHKVMSLNIEVHHAFVDGYHVGKFIEHLQEQLNHA